MSGFVDHILDLGLGLTKTTTHHHHLKKQPPANYFEPSLTLSLSGETASQINAPPSYGLNNNNSSTTAEETAPYYSSQTSPRYCHSTSVASSLSHNVVVVVKRERETTVAPTMSEEVEAEKTLSRGGSDGEEDEGNTRKKLRLTKEQSVLLEESFKQHSTLNPKQKQALANQLNLRPRQVEVWFQNRRARTKLKQTEVDCELLKKCCETLTDENRRLQKELQELKSLKLTNPFYMRLPAATLSMCPSCERIGSGVGNTTTTHHHGVGVGVGVGVGGGIGATGGNSSITFAAKSHHHHHHHQLYNSYTNPSAAC